MGCPPCKTFTPRLIGLSRGVTKRKKISKINFVLFVCFGFVLFLSQRGLSPAVIRGSNWCEVNFEKISVVLFCFVLVLSCLFFVPAVMGLSPAVILGTFQEEILFCFVVVWFCFVL